jgi:PhnB protein
MSAVNPYLIFNGTCGEAFEFYRSVIGGDFAVISKFSDMPPEMPVPESEANKILHVSLPIGTSILLGSDCPASMPPVVEGNNFSVAYLPSSREEADRVFQGLSAGGEVKMPMQDVFWGAYFGMFTDKFGINWQVNL